MTHVKSLLIGLITALFVFFSAALALPATSFAFTAGDPTSALTDVNDTLNLNEDENAAFDTIANVINIVLGLLGLIFFLLTLYAGFLWMTAQGEGDQVTKAKTMLTQAVIGLVVILSAFAISQFVLAQLIAAAQ